MSTAVEMFSLFLTFYVDFIFLFSPETAKLHVSCPLIHSKQVINHIHALFLFPSPNTGKIISNLRYKTIRSNTPMSNSCHRHKISVLYFVLSGKVGLKKGFP